MSGHRFSLLEDFGENCIITIYFLCAQLVDLGLIRYLASLATAGPGEKIKARYRRIILVIIDSAAVIALARIVEFVVFLISPNGPIGNNAFYTIFDLMPQITVCSNKCV